MKKYLISGLSLLGLLVISACGGGSGGGSSTPIPTTAPVSYKVHVKFTGGDSLQSPQSLLRGERIVSLHPMDTTTVNQLPITFSVLAENGSYFGENGAQSSGIAQVTVVPQPSPLPQVTFALSGLNVSSTPLPVVTPAPGSTSAPIQEDGIQSSSATTVGAGTLSVSVPAPVSTTAPVPVYVVNRAGIACSPTVITGGDSMAHPSDQVGGVSFVSGKAVKSTSYNPGSDLYIDGSNCTGPWFMWNPTQSQPTLNAPYGAVLVSSTVTPFASLAASSWSNSLTSISIAALATGATSATNPLDMLLLKTADGHVVKVAINDIGNGSVIYSLNFSYEESGYSVDGF